jgi:diacylglycerol kinase (ATP)
VVERKNWGYSSDIFTPDKPLRLGVLNNPLSGANRKGLRDVRKFLMAYPQVLHRDVQTPGDVASALADFARREINLVAINGGDGTIQAALTVMYHKSPFERIPLLALLRAGTTSMTARDVGLKGSRAAGLRRLLKWVCDGEGEAVLLQRPVLRVRTAPDVDPVFGMFLGTASIYQGIQFCNNRLNRPGFRGEWAPGLTIALFLIAVAFRGDTYVAPVPITVALDENPPEVRDCFLLMVSALDRLFLGLRPYWGKESEPLHYTAVNSRPQHLVRALPALIRGRTNRYGTAKNGYISCNVQRVRLTMNGGFTLDGQLFEAKAHLGPIVVQNGGTASFLRL